MMVVCLYATFVGIYIVILLQSKERHYHLQLTEINIVLQSLVQQTIIFSIKVTLTYIGELMPQKIVLIYSALTQILESLNS